jgi:hypothetical protein
MGQMFSNLIVLAVPVLSSALCFTSSFSCTSVDCNAASSMERADGRKPVKMQSAISDYPLSQYARIVIMHHLYSLVFFLYNSFHTWTSIISSQVSPATCLQLYVVVTI